MATGSSRHDLARARVEAAYQVHGHRVPSVTEVLRIAGINRWGDNPPRVVREKADLGMRVHEWIEMLELGFLKETDEPDEDLLPYIKSYRKFRAEIGDWNVTHTELRLVSEQMGFGGTIDQLASRTGVPIFADLKTTAAIEPEHALQLAGYSILLEDTGYGGREPHCLYLGKEGYKLKTYEEAEWDRSKRIFLSALHVAAWKIANKMEKL